MKTKLLLVAFVLALMLNSSPMAAADQIDNEAKELATAPAGMLVKVNPKTKTVEIFRAAELSTKIVNKSASKSELASAVNAIEKPLNKIAEFKLIKSELDKDSSTEAWCHRWHGYGYRWDSWGGYRPYYFNWGNPYYYNPGYFTFGSYNYIYNYSYAYNNCYYGWYY